MADTVRVDLEQNSKYRVTYDLMKHIADAEGYPFDSDGSREYYLRLYKQCWLIVYHGKTVEEVLRDNPAPNMTFPQMLR